MNSIISENIKRYITDKRKILLLAVFAFFCGAETGKAQISNMSIFEYVLFVMSNHYYVIYFMLIVYIFFLFDSMRDETELMRIRLKTVRNQFVCRGICIFIQTFIYVAVHFVLATVIGVMRPGLDYSGRFSVTAIEGYYNETIEFILEYSRYFKSPMVACVLTGIYMIIGLTFMAVIIYVLRNVAGRKISLIAVGIMIADIMIGFKIGINEVRGILFLNNYFIFHHALFGSGIIYMLLIVIIEVLIIFLGMKIFEQRMTNRSTAGASNRYIYEMSKAVYRNSILFLCGYVVANLIWVLLMNNGKVNIVDIIFSNVAGYSNSNFYIFEFVRYIIFFAVPIYIIGVMSEREKKMCNVYVAVRFGYKNWRRQIAKNYNIFILKYYAFFIGILGATAVVSGLVTGYNRGCDGAAINSVAKEFAEYMNIDEVQIGYLILFATIIRFFELLYYKEIYMLIYRLVKNSIASFILTFLGYIVVISVRVPGVSFGASAVYNLAEDVVQYGMVTTFFITLSILAIKKCLLRLVNTYSRNHNAKWRSR